MCPANTSRPIFLFLCMSLAVTSSNFSNHEDNEWCATVGINNNTVFSALYENDWTDNRHYICQYDYDNETVLSSTTSTSSVNCSPRWIVYPNMRGTGADQDRAATTLRNCLLACVADSRCVAAEWNPEQDGWSGCWKHNKRNPPPVPHPGITRFEIVRQCHQTSDFSCDYAFQIGSTCYKIHKEERVRWFTAVNRCLSNNATLAVFDDNVCRNIPSSLLSGKAWIGLVKSWWAWPDDADVLYNKFNVTSSSPPYNPPEHPNSDYDCVVATSGQWRVSLCTEQHTVVCQSDTMIATTTTQATTTEPARTTEQTTTLSGIITSTSVPAGGHTPQIPLAVGLTVGLLILIIIIVVVVVVIWRRRRRSTATSSDHRHDHRLQQQHPQHSGPEENVYVNGDVQAGSNPDIIYADIDATSGSIVTPPRNKVPPPPSKGKDTAVIYSDLENARAPSHTVAPSNDLYAVVRR